MPSIRGLALMDVNVKRLCAKRSKDTNNTFFGMSVALSIIFLDVACRDDDNVDKFILSRNVSRKNVQNLLPTKLTDKIQQRTREPFLESFRRTERLMQWRNVIYKLW